MKQKSSLFQARNVWKKLMPSWKTYFLLHISASFDRCQLHSIVLCYHLGFLWKLHLAVLSIRTKQIHFLQLILDLHRWYFLFSMCRLHLWINFQPSYHRFLLNKLAFSRHSVWLVIWVCHWWFLISSWAWNWNQRFRIVKIGIMKEVGHRLDTFIYKFYHIYSQSAKYKIKKCC